MANRFLDSNYYKSPFVKSLPGELKSFYSFIICDCTASGIWCLDFDAAKLYTGFVITERQFQERFVLTKKAIKVSNGRYFFPDFIEHQYPGGLSDNNKAHKNILAELRKFNLLTESNLPKKEAPLEEPLEVPLKGVQGNGNGLGNGLGLGLGNTEPHKKVFNNFPKPEDFNGLPEIYVNQAIELVRLIGRCDIDIGTVNSFWEIFKIQELTGGDHYQNEGKVYSHFLNVIKKQKFTTDGAGKTTIADKQQAGIEAAAARGRQKFNAARSKNN